MLKRSAQAGQALVLVLLSLAVVLTLVLFILSRTVTDIAVSTNEEEAIRAFSAAEAGIEKALIIGSTGDTPIGAASFNANVTGFSEGTPTFNYPINLASGDSATLWFVNHDISTGAITTQHFSGDSVKVCWGKSGASDSTATTPAIEMTVFYDDGLVKVGRAALDPNAGRTATNSFTNVSGRNCTIDGVEYAFWENIDLTALTGGATDSLLFAKLRMFYNSDENQIVGFDVTGAGDLPSQGLDIESLGTSGSANRRIEVFQAWAEAPGIFEYSLFSVGGLVKP